MYRQPSVSIVNTNICVSPAVEVNADARPTLAVPGAVGVPGQQTVWLRQIAAAVGQGQLENLRPGADVHVLLQGETGKKRSTEERDEAETRDG